ncbi:hypothetical protein V6N13_043120 [Hibiscus sabdariffa]|uniref:Uncharacterized protein n=1 Tax=Hibiscus sabdariffa TaxID=183260 RepID=A0ABR2G2I2_9ROSI
MATIDRFTATDHRLKILQQDTFDDFHQEVLSTETHDIVSAPTQLRLYRCSLSRHFRRRQARKPLQLTKDLTATSREIPEGLRNVQEFLVF